MRFRLPPVAGQVTERVVPGGAWCFELEQGAQHGTRIGFDPDANATVPFDAPGVGVLADGHDRFWIHWPATLDATRPLVLTAWRVPGRYTRVSGHEREMPHVHLLARAEASPGVGGSTTFGPWSHVPYAQLGDGSHLRLSRGARLVVECGGSIGGGSPSLDVSIEERILDGGAFRHIAGARGAGVPSKPASEIAASLERPAPLGEFQVRVGYAAAGTIWVAVYLLTGP